VQYVLIAITLGLTILSVYVFLNRKRLKKDCGGSCALPQ
jgi:hypothetical protein